MRYITAEQFKEQPREVQQALKDWAELNFKKMDLIYDAYHDEMSHIEQDIDVGRSFYLHKRITWDNIQCPDIIPLFTLQQLWEFIEDKTNFPVIANYLTDEYWVQTDDWWNEEEKCFYDKDKLQAFWKCACEVGRVIKEPQQMNREQLLQELDQYKFVPGHGPDYSKMSDEQLSKALKGHKAMFEHAFGRKEI